MLQKLRDIQACITSIFHSRANGAEYVEKIPFTPAWVAGSSALPHLLQNESRTFLLYQIAYSDPCWGDLGDERLDVSWNAKTHIAVVEWHACLGATLGGLDVENQGRHRLSRKGMWDGDSPTWYSAREVKNSRWVNEIRGSEVVSRTDYWSKTPVRHFMLLFHDSTFECVAQYYEVTRLHVSWSEAIAYAVQRLDSAESGFRE